MRTIYRILRLYRDIRAILKGRASKRLANRLIGRYVVRRLWRR